MQDDPVPDIIYLSVYLVLAQGLKEEVDQPQSLFLARNPHSEQPRSTGLDAVGLAGKESLSQWFCTCALVRGSRGHPGLPKNGDMK